VQADDGGRWVAQALTHTFATNNWADRLDGAKQRLFDWIDSNPANPNPPFA
jgi:hypothetical protein